MNAVLTKDQILGANDLKTERVHVPVWGGDVLIRAMTGAERDRFEDHCARLHGKSCEDIMAILVALTIVDDKGQRLFSEADVKALSEKSAAALGMLFDKAKHLNAIDAKDVEDLAKN